MAEIRKSKQLPCTSCGGLLFTLVVNVNRHSNGGMADVPAGKVCVKCATTLNTRASWQKIQIEEQAEKMRQLLEQGELELEGLLIESQKAAEEAGIGLDSIVEAAKKRRKPVTREETELGKTLDSSQEES